MAIVTEVRKSQSFSNEKPFAVVRFRKGGNGSSKFAVGSLNDGNSYSLTYNLSLIYPDVVNDDNEFDAREAYKLFKAEMQIGMEESVNCYDVPISEISEFKAVIIVSTKRRMEVMHPACYGTKEDAVRIARASLERQLREKTFKPAADTIANDDDDGDELWCGVLGLPPLSFFCETNNSLQKGPFNILRYIRRTGVNSYKLYELKNTQLSKSGVHSKI